MGCCKWFFILTTATVVFLILLPTPKNVEVGQFQPGETQNLEDLHIPLNRLDNARYIDTQVRGPQDVEIDSQGFLYTGLSDGSLIKINIETEQKQKIGQFNGQILGLAMSESEERLALATLEGLVLFSLKDKSSKLLVSGYNGKQFAALNSVTFAGENKLYFTVSGSIPMKVFHEQLLYRLNEGQLFSYDIETNKTELLVQNLALANGIGYMKSENCLYMNQLQNHRMLRFSLNPKNYMERSFVINSTFGYFDNLKVTKDGYLWVGVSSLRDHVTNLIESQRFLRKILLNLGVPVEIFLATANMSYSGGVKIDPRKGQIVDYLFGNSDKIFFVTSINEKNGKIFLASLLGNNIAVIEKEGYESVKAQQDSGEL